jgi:CRP-like cAMP-binding protein/formate hydrogenlyase subunit 6/NADH:ubiquinone oxidoreductase subunit I
MTVEAEYELQIDDTIVTAGRTFDELARKGPIELTIDGQKVSLPLVKTGVDASGKVVTLRRNTVYDAANKLYVEQLNKRNPIPVLCHREHMTPVAVCRVCMVDVNGRLVPACQFPLWDKTGMVVSTIDTSPRVERIVRTLTELLVGEHLVEREAGRQYGENELETLAKRLSVTQSRFPKSTKFTAGEKSGHARDDSSVLVAVDHTACILCDRCVRGCNEIRHNEIIGRMGKGYTARIAFDLDTPMGASGCVECGECMISCPTGALTFKQFVKPQPWKDEPKLETVRAGELAQHPLFAGVSSAFLKWNEGSVVRRHFKKGDVICREGTFGSSAFLMEKGRFEVRIQSPLSHVKKEKGGLFGLFSRFASGLVSRDLDHRDEESQSRFIHIGDAPVSLALGDPVAVLDAHDVIFGEMTCMSQYPRAATVTAAEDCTVLEILRNVLYMLQRSKASKAVLDDVYRRRALDSHLRGVTTFAKVLRVRDQFTRFVDFLRPRVKLFRLHPGQVVFRQGDPADHFYMVRVGFVKVSENRSGGEHVLNYIGPGGYFGEIGLLSHIPEVQAKVAPGVRTATCSALDHVELVRVTGEDFLALLTQFPQLRNEFIEEALSHIDDNEKNRNRLVSEPLSEFLSQGLMNAQSILVLDLEKCTRCDECTKACADVHDGVTRLIREGLRFDKFLVASSCRSCMDPYCMVGCPVGSIRRKNSREIIIEDWCIGCGKCAENCPYGNINMHGFDTGRLGPDPLLPDRMIPIVQQKATTCDLCVDVDGQPSCVYACPHDAAHRMSGRELLSLVPT